MANSAIVGTLKAVLSADTAEFTRAMQGASAEVKELGKKLQSDLEPRQRAVNQAVREFLGGNEIRRAQEYAIAIEKIGDVSKLTASDQLKVNKAVNEAIDHYKALGQQAPQSMLALRDATAHVHPALNTTDKLLGNIWSGLKSAAGLIGVTFTASAVINFAGKVFDAASNINDMALKLGVSAEAAQRFKFAAEQSGATIDDVERAISFMNRSLAEGDKSTVKALSQAGLEFAKIRAMKPEDAFRTIADAVGQIPDPMRRAQVAQELFGKGALDLLPGMIEGYTKLGESASVMSNETVQRLEKAQDAWEAFGNRIIIVSGEMLGAMVSDASAALSGWSKLWEDIKATASGGLEGHRQFVEDLAKATRELTEDQKQYIKTQVAAGVSTDLLVRMVGASEASVRAYAKELSTANTVTATSTGLTDDQKKALDKAAASALAHSKQIQAITDKLTGQGLVRQVNELAEAYERLTPEQKANVVVMARVVDEVMKLYRAGAVLDGVFEQLVDEQTRFRNIAAQTRGTLIDLNSVNALPAVIANYKRLRDEATATAQAFIQSKINLELNTAQVIASVQAFQGLKPPPPPDMEKWSKAFGEAADGFQQLAQIAGGEMGKVARSIGIVIGALGQLTKSIDQISKGGTANLVAGMSGVIGATVAIADFADSFRTPEYLRIMRDVGERWGVEISGGIAKAIQASKAQIAKDVGGGGGPIGQRRADELLRQRPEFRGNATKDALREVAELLHLADVIADAGGLTAANAREWETRARDLFNVVAIGGRTGAEATRELSDVVRLFADQATKTGGLWSTAFQAIIADAKATGLELEGLTDAINAQLATAASATAKIVGGFVSTLPDLPEGERTEGDEEKIAAIVANTQAQFDRVSRIALASFNAMIANGRSAAEAIAMIGPSIDELAKKADEFGFAGSAAFDQLRRWRDLTSDNQGLLDQVAGLNELMVALANVGALDVQTFKDLQAEGSAAFESLRAAGFTEQEALAQMAPFLEDIIKLHKDRGLAIDDETQKLIDQAREHGLLKDEEISTNDILMQGIGALIEALGGELPDAWRKMATSGKDAAKEVEDALNNIKAPVIKPKIEWPDMTPPLPGNAPDPPYNPNNPNDPYGGVDPGNLPSFQHGGFGDFGRDGEPVMLHGREWVIPDELLQAWRQQPSSPATSMLDHAERTGSAPVSVTVSPSQPAIVVKTYLNNRQVAEAIVPEIPAIVKRHRLA